MSGPGRKRNHIPAVYLSYDDGFEKTFYKLEKASTNLFILDCVQQNPTDNDDDDDKNDFFILDLLLDRKN